MLRENDIKVVRKIFEQHHYVMSTAEILKAKLYYADIKQLLDEGYIERIRRGYYHWIESCETREIVIINTLFPDAVLCMETALFYYKYSDRNPAEWCFAIDRNVSKLRTNIEYPFIKAYRMEKAKEMLEETHEKIVQISYAVGYPNVSYFCQSFREFYGVSPQKFRNTGEEG